MVKNQLVMTDKELLEQRFRDEKVSDEDLAFGRIMPFGKHKGMYLYRLLVKHPYYMNWILENTQFTLTETEAWWKEKIDNEIKRLERVNMTKRMEEYNRYLGESNYDAYYDDDLDLGNIEDPYWIVE